MRKSLRIAGMSLVLFLAYDSVKAQVKIGGDPAVIDPNAILELDNSRKGLLLPRLELSGWNILYNRNPQPGMVVYLKPGADPRGEGFYVKTGTDIAAWSKMSGESAGNGPWKLNGNAVSANDWLGTSNTFPLVFKADNQTVMSFDPLTGNVTIPYANVPDAAAASNEVLIIGTNGLVQKKDLSLTSVTALNSLQGAVTLTVTPGNTVEVASLTNPASTKTLDLKLPIMTGATNQQYGFMTIADWRKLQALTSATGIRIGDVLTSSTDQVGAEIERLTGVDEGKMIIHMVEASASEPGIVNTGAQTFSGAKTFNGNMVVSGTSTIEGDARIEGLATFIGDATFNENLTLEKNATLKGTVAVTGTSTFADNVTVGKDLIFTTPKAFSTATPANYKMAVVNDAASKTLEFVTIPAHSLGGISTVKVGTENVKAVTTDGSVNLVAGKDGTGFNIAGDAAASSITINVPDASATAAGLVTIADQSFAGNKTFAGAVNVGGNTITTSKLNVNGSMAVPFKVLPPGDYTLGDTDYMVLAQCSSTGTGAVGETEPSNTITLPAAASCANRVYIIRRIQRVTNEIALLHIATAGGQISGHNQITISEPGFTVTVASDGTNWHLVSRSVM